MGIFTARQAEGGADNYGSVFRSSAGMLTTLYSFDGRGGYHPSAALIESSNGNFYGTTYEGYRSGGTAFKITPGGTYNALQFLLSTFVRRWSQSRSGAPRRLTGTSTAQHRPAGPTVYGTVFKLTPEGALTVLHSFCSIPVNGACTDWRVPRGGCGSGCRRKFLRNDISRVVTYIAGSLFEVTPGGTLTTLYNFCSQSGCTDGDYPNAPLVEGTDGNFYGNTYWR